MPDITGIIFGQPVQQDDPIADQLNNLPVFSQQFAAETLAMQPPAVPAPDNSSNGSDLTQLLIIGGIILGLMVIAR